MAERIAAEMRFFHWELEFPDVFRETGAGFDAILGNPPWDIAKPVSKEFFSNIDPLYRSYGKQEALRRQTAYFEDGLVEGDWLDYNARFRAQSNFTSHAASPFGDPEDNDKSGDRFTIVRGYENRELHDTWREARDRTRGFADPSHPFRHQGSADVNLYKLFLEAAHTLLKPVGRMGFVVPSGLYSDNGTGALRRLFVEHCRWEWLFGIENREGIFPIHRSYKFNPVIIEKGEATEAIRTVFMRRNLDDWERAEDLATRYTRQQVERFSPKSRAILEIQSKRDLEILEKIYANSILLGDDGPDGWGIRYAREFDMTNDSHLFPPRPQWEAKGYRPDEYSRWLLGDWRPIEELWEELGLDPSRPEPVEVELEDWLFDTTADPERREAEARFVHGHWLKPGDVAKTEWRMRCAQPPYDALPVARAQIPAGVVLSREGDAWIRESRVGDVALPFYEGRMLGLCDASQKGWVSGKGRRAIWRQLPWESKRIEPQYLMSRRNYVSGTTFSGAPKPVVMDVTSSTNSRTMIAASVTDLPCGNKTPTLTPSSLDVAQRIAFVALAASMTFDWGVRQRLSGTTLNWHILESLAVPNPRSLPGDFSAQVAHLVLSSIPFASEWLRLSHAGLRQHPHACSPLERLRIMSMLDAVVAVTMGLSDADYRHFLAECDRPSDRIDGANPKGFWRIDREKNPELRQTILNLVALRDLLVRIEIKCGNREEGIKAFLTQNHGEGWMLPETLRLVDYGMGHDARAEQSQPVASRLGPRFYDWQLVQSIDESWRECHLHARNLLGTHGYAMLLVDLVERRVAEGGGYLDLLTNSFTRKLVGEEGYVTTLLQIRAREVLRDNPYWAVVTDLCNEGHLDKNAYNHLLDGLHARKLISDFEYRRRTGREAPPPRVDPLSQVAEPEVEYKGEPPKKGQTTLFE